MMISTTNFTETPQIIACMSANKTSPRLAKRSTIAILIVLFATNMVASSFLGFCNSLMTILSLVFSRSDISVFSRSVGDNEKKATSAPLISAEHASSSMSTIILRSIVLSKASSMIKGSGSGSNRL